MTLTAYYRQSLDIQYTTGVATNVNTAFLTVGSQNQDGVFGFLDIINTLLAEPNPPHVLTTSFGFDETFFQANPGIATYALFIASVPQSIHMSDARPVARSATPTHSLALVGLACCSHLGTAVSRAAAPATPAMPTDHSCPPSPAAAHSEWAFGRTICATL